MGRLKKASLPLQLIIIVLVCLFFGKYIPQEAKSFFYGLSLSLKDILMFFLPFIIFSYLFSCMLSFEKSGLVFIILLLGSVCFSNFISNIMAYGISSLIVTKSALVKSCALSGNSGLQPLWIYPLPQIIPNDMALLGGFALGFMASLLKIDFVKKAASTLKNLSTFFLIKIFIPIVPLFIVGFLLKMEADDTLSFTISSFGAILTIVATAQVLYTSFLYFAAAKFKFKIALNFIRNQLSAGLTAFSSMSSAAALPLSIQAAEQNTKSPELARVIMPSTVNIHLIGDSIGVPIIAIILLNSFGFEFIGFTDYLIFSFYFVLAKFAVAAVPGGGIFVIAPVLQAHLGFSPEMVGLITAIYILFDPINTGVNTMGNGAFAILFTRFFHKMSGK